MWEVIVGNVGTVYRGKGELQAKNTFKEYVAMSKSGSGRAGGEGVLLLAGGEIVDEHEPKNWAGKEEIG